MNWIWTSIKAAYSATVTAASTAYSATVTAVYSDPYTATLAFAAIAGTAIYYKKDRISEWWNDEKKYTQAQYDDGILQERTATTTRVSEEHANRSAAELNAATKAAADNREINIRNELSTRHTEDQKIKLEQYTQLRMTAEANARAAEANLEAQKLASAMQQGLRNNAAAAAQASATHARPNRVKQRLAPQVQLMTDSHDSAGSPYGGSDDDNNASAAGPARP